MKEPNLTSLLRAWIPRPASPELHEKLFPRKEPTKAPARTSLRDNWNWLAPAALCAITVLLATNERSHLAGRIGAMDTNLFFASMTLNSMASSDSNVRSNFTLTKADLNLERNVWREASFESTNHAQTRSSMHSLPYRQTNSLQR